MGRGSGRVWRQMFLTVFFASVMFTLGAGLSPEAIALEKDFTGDAKSDLGVLYDYDQGTSKFWTFTSDGANFTPAISWASNPGWFNAKRSKVVSGDFNGDAKSDLAVLYDYDEGTSKIWTFTSDGANFTPAISWASNPGWFNAKRSKVVSGDFNNDGLDDIAVLYDYGGGTSKIWTFTSDGTNFTPAISWASEPGWFTASRSKLVSGDLNNDGFDDLSVLYDYDGGTSKIWTFTSNGVNFTPAIAWASNPGWFNAKRSKVVSGDFNGDARSDLAVLYDYGGGTSKIWTFTSDGTNFTPAISWSSNPGWFTASRSKIVSGDFNGDTRSDLAVLYDYDGGTSKIWTFKSDGTNFTPAISWASNPGWFTAPRSKLADEADDDVFMTRPIDYVIGYSVLGRPIMATRIGYGNRRYLFIGVHHGDEPQGGRVLELFRNHLIAHPEVIPADVEVWILPYLNPDGLASGTRWNARGVNLNRNYWTNDWGLYDVTSLSILEMSGLAPMSDMSAIVTGTPFTFNYPGPQPFSEPETAAIANLCAGTSFRAMISIHDMEGNVYWGQHGQDLAYLYSAKTGLPVAGGLFISGDATRWIGQAYGSPAITVEMTEEQVYASPTTTFNVFLPAFMETLGY
ncbi:MAG: FG-GAP-like repeat-containing protein [Actinomycetota bacterium]